MADIRKRAPDVCQQQQQQHDVSHNYTAHDSSAAAGRYKSSSPTSSPTSSPGVEPPLHAKDLKSRLDYDKLEELDSATPETAAALHHALGWVRDPSRYEKVAALAPNRPARKAPYTTLSSAHVARLLQAGTIRRIHPAQVKGYVRVFGVFEEAKFRIRPIKEPRDINDILGPETLNKMDMATKALIIELVQLGEYYAAFDFAAYYDQFLLHPEIGVLQCFKKGRNFYCLTASGMGQRQMPEVAHSATRKMADLLGRRCHTAAIIDNVIFVGKTADDVEHDATAFAERAQHVGGTLNEDTTNIREHIKTEGDWGGVHFDLKKKCVCLTEKIINKIRASWDNRASWTYRNYAAHMGLLFWAIGLTDVFIGDYFPALQYYAHVCRNFSMMDDQKEANKFWDQEAIITGETWPALAEWTAEVLKNRPLYTLARHESDPDWLVCVDSCRFGWGYMAVSPCTGEIRYHGQRWSHDFVMQNRDKMHQSVFTEPHGVNMAMCHLLSYSDKHQQVRIWTDSVTTMSSGNKGYNSRSESINECVRSLRKSFPPEHFTFQFEFIPGVENIVADALSRGREVTPTQVQGAAAALNSALLEGVAARRVTM